MASEAGLVGTVDELRGGVHSEDAPISWHALELVGAAFFEAQERPGEDPVHGVRDQSLAAVGQRHDARADVNVDPTNATVRALLEFAEVDPRPNHDPDLS